MLWRSILRVEKSKSYYDVMQKLADEEYRHLSWYLAEFRLVIVMIDKWMELVFFRSVSVCGHTSSNTVLLFSA